MADSARQPAVPKRTIPAPPEGVDDPWALLSAGGTLLAFAGFSTGLWVRA